ncbi:hypothetical protein GII36_00295 [Candidatus Mycosynbacter amalyticus]|uniref:Uncharacterized protein n=1 Tax=Candidatus Mycosynbacter amalyticus TaxID=2665156 RepID=A0A857MMA9_9BACT|nr:SRPBCC family protein [Candidatus Mycosynbacter amalyticus]QHN42301.1 hypothetical protein GII36_00295 [Candidatus Mycosynbacter amalyticus]
MESPKTAPARPALQATVQLVIKAPRQELYEFISNIENMGQLSPENQKTFWFEQGKRLKGRNRIGALYRWSMTGTVTEDIPAQSFGFFTDWPSETHWLYTFEDVTGGTLVTESMRKDTKQILPVIFM